MLFVYQVPFKDVFVDEVTRRVEKNASVRESRSVRDHRAVHQELKNTQNIQNEVSMQCGCYGYSPSSVWWIPYQWSGWMCPIGSLGVETSASPRSSWCSLKTTTNRAKRKTERKMFRSHTKQASNRRQVLHHSWISEKLTVCLLHRQGIFRKIQAIF